MNRQLFLLSLFTFLAWLPCIVAKKQLHIICDLGGVLCDTNTTAAFWHIGPLRYILYTVSTWPHTKPTKYLLYQAMNEFLPHQPGQMRAYDNQGYVLPQLMGDWLSGKRSPDEILTFMYEKLSTSPHYSLIERSLLQSILSLLFDPEIFIHTRSIIPEGLAFVQKCKAQGHKVYLLSNWDAHSFPLMDARFPELFSLFDGIMISGETGLLKPDPTFFYELLDAYNLDTRSCIFLDDQKENIIAAQKMGIASALITQNQGLLVSSPDFVPAYDLVAQKMA